MRFAVRSIGVALLTLLAARLLALTSTMTNAFTLAATVYILKGTNSAFNQIPDSAYPPFAHDYDQAVGAPALRAANLARSICHRALPGHLSSHHAA